MSGNRGLEQSRRLQDAALASLGLFRYKVPEDGNCLFRAVASQLQLEQEAYHKPLREAAAAWMNQHAGDLMAAGLLESVAEIREAGTEGKWCGQAALVALANVLKVNIAVVQGGDQGAIDIQHVAPFDGATASEHPGILLAYLYSGHYDAVVHEPGVSNPDYAVWAARCSYNDAVSERAAIKLSDAMRTSVANPPPNAAAAAAAVRAMLHKEPGAESGPSKVSCMKIDLQPVKPSSGVGSGDNANTSSTMKILSSSSRSNDRRRPSFDSNQEATGVPLSLSRSNDRGRRPSTDNTHNPALPSSSRDANRGRRPSFEHDPRTITSMPPSPRHPTFRPSKSEVHAPSSRRAQSESPDLRQRRASSPGPTTTRHSPFTSIRAAMEKHRRRSGSREAPIELPYNYDGSIRLFGGSNKPGSLTDPRERDRDRDRDRERENSAQYNKANLRKSVSTGSNGHSHSNSPSVARSPTPANLRKTVSTGSNSNSQSVPRSPTPGKNFGVDLKSTSSSRRIVRQTEQEEEYMPPRQLPPKQLSLNKDFGIEEQSRHEVRRSSEGANLKKSSMPAAYVTSKPSFGVDFSSKGKSSPMQKPKSLKCENGYGRDTTDSASKPPPKVPPKVLPKPPIQGDVKTITVIPIRLNSSGNTVDKEQQLPSQPPLQNGYDSTSQRPVKIRSVSQQEASKSVPQQPLNRASSSPGQRSSSGSGSRSRQQLSQEATERQYQRMRGEREEHRTRSDHRNGSTDQPRERQEQEQRSRTRSDHRNGSSGSSDQAGQKRERHEQEQRSRTRSDHRNGSSDHPPAQSRQEQGSRTRSDHRNGSSDPPTQPRTRTRTREDKEGFEGFHKQRVRSRERRRSADHHHRKIADAANESSKQQQNQNQNYQHHQHQNENYIETADIVTTPTEPLENKKKQYMPYVGLSPSQSRKVNVQVSTEDHDVSTQMEPDPIIIHSPHMVRDASTGSSSCTIKSGVGSLTSIPLSPISPSPFLGGLGSSKPPHLSPGPYSPGPGVSVPSSPSPGISRIVQVAQNPALEIPLRNNPEQPPPRRRSVVEIQPQQVQTPAPSTGKGIAKVPMFNLKSSNSSDKKGKANGSEQHKSQARMFFS